MAASNIPLLTGAILYTNTDVDETEDDISAAAVTIYEIELDNTANAAATYYKFYNTNTVTVGTTAPDMIFMVAASVSRTIVIPSGLAFATALTVAAVTAGGTAGVTGPTSAATVKLVYV